MIALNQILPSAVVIFMHEDVAFFLTAFRYSLPGFPIFLISLEHLEKFRRILDFFRVLL